MRKYAAIAAPLLLLLAGCRGSKPASDRIETNDQATYHAVLLTNGSVYFGKLEGLGSPYPVLRDVYYVQSSQNPETKAVTNVLVKRGGELHSPDRMILNEKAIVFVEPVGPDSKVAQLIAQSKK
jgi:hypothetical protein